MGKENWVENISRETRNQEGLKRKPSNNPFGEYNKQQSLRNGERMAKIRRV